MEKGPARAPHASPDPGSPEARVGTVVRDKWRIDALLGSGGMATVFAATHRNGRRAALKILHAEFARDGNLKDRFLREGYVGNKIPHAGRVECLDNDTTEDGAPFLVMELLEGETLDQIWKRLGRRLPVAAALNVAEQLLDFLAACHAQGIIHRDLKPANVFLTHQRQVKVLDFGIAQLREGQAEHTRAGTTLGTPSFMSPEQARGLGDQLDGRSDLYSVGAMLYALLSGNRLNKGRTHDEALIMAATQPAPSLARAAPDLPTEVIALVDKSLAWDRRNRYADATEMRADVLRILDKLGVKRVQRAEPPPPAPGVAPAELDVEDVSAEIHEEEAEEGDHEIVPDDHPDVERLRGVMRQVERLLPSVRQYGWAHPETERKLRGAFEEVVTALGALPDNLQFTLRPYSFAHRGREVWEPSAPLDTIPYALFEAGLRTLRLRPGITEGELRSLVTVMLLDPSTELAPEDDLSTVLWDLGLPHVEAEVADGFAEGGAAAREAFYEESDELERLAEQAAAQARAEAKAMAVTVDRAATDSSVSNVGLDPTARLALSTQLVLSTDRWTERYIDVLVEAIVHVRSGVGRSATHDPALVTAPLALSAADLVVAGRAHVVLSLHAGLLDVLSRRVPPEAFETLATELTAAMLGGQNFQLLVRALAALDRGAEGRAALVTALTTALERLPAVELPQALAALPTVDAELRGPLLAFVARAAVGRERELLARREEWPVEVTRAVLGVLARLGTKGANAAMIELANTTDVALRIEVLAARPDGRELLGKELGKLVEHQRAEVRAAALAAIAQHDVKDCAGALVRRVEDPQFHELPGDERREILRVLQLLSPPRAETLAIEQLGQRAMLKSESREETRLMLAELLGDHGRTPAALEALQAAAKGWWGTSASLKNAALDAAGRVDQRLRRGG